MTPKTKKIIVTCALSLPLLATSILCPIFKAKKVNADIYHTDEGVTEISPTIFSDFDCFVSSTGATESTFSAPLFSVFARYMTPDYEYVIESNYTEDVPGFGANIWSEFGNLHYNTQLPNSTLVTAQNVQTNFYVSVDGDYERPDEITYGISLKNAYVHWSQIHNTLGNIWLVLLGGATTIFNGHLSYFDVNEDDTVSYNATTTLHVPNDYIGVQPLTYNQSTSDFLERMRSVPTNQDGYAFIEEFKLTFNTQAQGVEDDRNGWFYLYDVPSYLIDPQSYPPDYNPTIINVVSPSPTEMLFAPIESFLTTEVFDGFTFGNLLTVMLGLALFGWFLRNFAGG